MHDAWLELSHDAKKIGGDKTNEFYERKHRLDRIITHIINIGNMRALFKVLSDKEEFLRDLQNQSGKGGKYRDEGAEGLSV